MNSKVQAMEKFSTWDDGSKVFETGYILLLKFALALTVVCLSYIAVARYKVHRVRESDSETRFLSTHLLQADTAIGAYHSCQIDGLLVSTVSRPFGILTLSNIS